MEGQESDSSSHEMETDSESDSSVDDTNQQSSSKSFAFKFLQSEDNVSKTKVLNTFFHNKNNFSEERKSFLIDKTKGPMPDNFTPWWESFNATKKSKASSSKDSQSDSQSYESWFDKSSTSKDNNSWLCGPKPQSSHESPAQFEDIEVPSIYGTITKPKGRKALKRERKEQRNKTTGKKWFDMKLPDVDSKTKMDMELLQMRRALDPKRHYKQNDRKGLPKYFQLGTVVDEGTDFYSSRLTKKQRKQTLVEELMADVKVRQYNKKKYEELQQKERFKKKLTKKRKT